jgi:SAM-dependent methyltransferase/ribosome-binding protein aMBF1 (putative translation factor)
MNEKLIMRSRILFVMTALVSMNVDTVIITSCLAFSAPIHKQSTRPYSKLYSGGFGSSNTKKKKQQTKKMNPNQAKRASQDLLQRYGGDIQKGTQARIDASLASLAPHLQEAATLYKQITQYDYLLSTMPESDQKRLIPPDVIELSRRNRIELQNLMKEHSLTENDLHNLFQRMTWDASADAKATRADIAGNKMKGDLQERISKACNIVVQAVKRAGDGGSRGKVLDVACGHGSIVPSLVEAGLEELDSYVGIDLSKEMIKNAMERYGTERNKQGKRRVFVADDFLTHDFSVYSDGKTDGDSLGVFDAIIFCSALHDLPDMENCIGRAASLLLPGGKLVVVHAQGAQHVLGQHQANPVLVQRGLPTTKEWNKMIEKQKDDWKLSLEYEPADPRSNRDDKEGYLAVLTKE